MEVTFSKATGRVPVTIIMINGSIDGSNYRDLIDQVRKMTGAGMKDLLLDLTHTKYMSSAGIVALHSIAKIMRKENLDAEEDGWDALRDIKREQSATRPEHFKLLNPQPRILDILTTVGLKDSFDIFTNIDEAVASF